MDKKSPNESSCKNQWKNWNHRNMLAKLYGLLQLEF